ncbi:MAG: hypothetical protein FWC96_07210 [Oscillospiraceae bacterium]|nr:hypothetical protein [Oscillospiraceae bacterium]
MTDNEYAVRIYCQVFNKPTDNRDAYVRGVLDAVSTLEPREQIALECYYRQGNSLEQVGQDIGGVGKYAADNVVKKAMRKLRHPSRYMGMSVAAMVGSRDKRLEDANAIIEKLYDQLELLMAGAPVDPAIQAELNSRKPSIHELGFSQRINNHFLCEGIYTVDALLVLDSLDRLMARRGFGAKSRDELILKMQEQGYDEWADRIKVQK